MILLKPSFLRKLILVIVMSIVVLAAVELGLRFYFVMDKDLAASIKKMTVFHPVLHPYYGHRDGKAMITAQIEKKPGEFLILLMGGSTAAGSGASSKEAEISAKLAKYLNEYNDIPGIKKFVVHCAAHHGYHTPQVAIQYYQHIVKGSEFDMLISIDGFNNLVRPIENYAYDLPLCYPGWYWVLYHRLMNKDRYFSLLRNYKDISDRRGPYSLLTVSLIATFNMRKHYDQLAGLCLQKLVKKASKMSNEEKLSVLMRGAERHSADILFMSKMSAAYNKKSLFVLEPLMGFRRKKISEYEKDFIENQRMYDARLADYNIWVRAYETLSNNISKLAASGVDALDYTDIFYDLEENPFADLMHMNDLGQDVCAGILAEDVIEILAKDRASYQNERKE